MSTPSRIIKVFIASPGDLAIERRVFKDTIDELNKGFGRGADVVFVPLGWEDALSQVGRRSQSAINHDVDTCDVFVLVMWRRWGQDAPDASPYTSYTEEEFYRALARFEESGAPTIFVFFKHIDPGQIADAGPQLTKVLDFRKKLEETRTVLFRSFADDSVFKAEIDRHLVSYARGEIEGPTDMVRVPLLPDSVISEIENLKAQNEKTLEEAERARAEAKNAIARAETAQFIAEAKAARASLALADRAARAALVGKIEEARQDFAVALDGATDVRVIFLGFQFFDRVGDWVDAEGLIRRALAIIGPEVRNDDSAEAHRKLGWVFERRGDLVAAAKLYLRAKRISQLTGAKEVLSDSLRGLGRIYDIRGELGRAANMFAKSLAIDEKLGRLKGVAANYGNLGIVERRRGNLLAAEEYHKDSLEIEKKLGRLEGLAIQYGNLGVIERDRGDLDAAEQYYRKALEIERKLCRLEGLANLYNNLGDIEQIRGNLSAAQKYLEDALEIDKKLGRLEGMAIHYSNLGNIERKRGNLMEVKRLWTLARDLYSKVGMKPEVDNLQLVLDSLL